MKTIKEAVALCDVLKNASKSSIQAIISHAYIRKICKGQHLFFDKSNVDSLYAVVEGEVSLYKLNSLEEKKVIFVYGVGSMLNEVMLCELPASINCEALSDAQVICFPTDIFLQIMSDDFALTKAVIDSMSIKIRRLYRQLKNTTGSLRGDKKLAAKLWKLSKDYGAPTVEGTCINLDLSITFLAEMLGSKRETVSRQMKILLEIGLVRQTKDGFVIPDRDALMKYFKSPS